MGEIEFINAAEAGLPNGPYQHAACAGGWLHLAGQIPIDANHPGGSLPDGIEAQTQLVFRNIRAILAAAGYRMSDVVHVRNYLRNLDDDLEGFNSVYARQFESGRFPPRTTIGVQALAKGALVEIDLAAYRKPV